MKIKESTLYKLLTAYGKPIIDGFQIIEDTILSSDPEDGGAEHTVVIKEIHSNSFFRGSYFDWDIDNTDYDEISEEIGENCDLDTDLVQVFPKEVTITIYE